MSRNTLSQEQIQRALSESPVIGREAGIKVLFSPITIQSANLSQTSALYRAMQELPFETFVIVETYEKAELPKKLPMPSADAFSTPFGRVAVNDALRNDFADEEDDFFIDDSAVHPDMSLYQQLMMLQCTRKKFDVVSIQIADSRPAILRELSWVLSEILSIKNAMAVFCCELDAHYTDELKEIQRLLDASDVSGLMNYLNSGRCHMKGAGAFIAGVLVAQAWELKVNFLQSEEHGYGSNLMAGFAGLARPA